MKTIQVAILSVLVMHMVRSASLCVTNCPITSLMPVVPSCPFGQTYVTSMKTCLANNLAAMILGSTSILGGSNGKGIAVGGQAFGVGGSSPSGQAGKGVAVGGTALSNSMSIGGAATATGGSSTFGNAGDAESIGGKGIATGRPG